MDVNEKTKKRVAVFANGWNSENVYRYTRGLFENTPECSIDYFMFVCHAVYSGSDVDVRAMSTIFDLPDLSTFDAAIMFTPGLNFTEIINQLIIKLERSGIPVISIGMQHPGFHYIGINNYEGMRELCNHIIEDHGVREVFCIAGSRENEDSNARIAALRDSMEAHGLTFQDSDIFYSNWEIGILMNEFTSRLRNGMRLPDAFVCANDLLAETISYILTDCGYSADSCIVTGFDYLDEGQNFYPSISSVDQHYDEAGRMTVELLDKIFAGERKPQELLVKCEVRPGESCGCLTCRGDDEKRRSLARSLPRIAMMRENFDGRFHAMEKEIIQSIDYDDLKENLRKLFYNTAGQENGNFYVMMDPHIVDFSLTDIANYPQYRYADKMDTFVAIRNRIPIEAGVIPTSELLPEYRPVGRNHIFFFVPVRYEGYVCGYLAIPDQIDWLHERYFQVCEGRFNRALVSYRRNMQLTALNSKLSMLMEKDSLTFVKNRTAYDRYIARLETTMASGSFDPFAVVCFDINDLKPINDTLGHEAGDEYIKNCCRFICTTFKHSPVFRIGGDEFVALAMHDDFEHRHELLEFMRNRMIEIRDNGGDLPPIERLSVASGMSDYNEHVDDDYGAIFRRADERMYQNKRDMKAYMR